MSFPSTPTPRPSPGDLNEASVSAAFAAYYWPRHFEVGPVDLASFLDRLFRDYTPYQERDLIGEWTADMSPVYRIYKVCLQYGTKNGTPAKAAEAKSYQKVFRRDACADKKRTLAREPGVQDVRDKFRQLTASRRLFGLSNDYPIPTPPAVTPPAVNVLAVGGMPGPSSPGVSLSPTHSPPLRTQSSRQEIPRRGASLQASARGANPVTQEDESIQHPSFPDAESPSANLETSTVQGESSTSPGTGQSQSGKRVRSSRSKNKLNYEANFEGLRHDDGDGQMTPKELQTRLDKAWETNLKKLQAVVTENPERIDDLKYSIPTTAQKDFIDAICILWIGELRKFFQRAILPENIDSIGNLKKAVVDTCRKEKQLTRLDNFGEGWDFARYVWLVEQLGKDMSRTWPKYEEILHHLKRCLSGRNVGAHECHSKKTENNYFTDKELHLLVGSAGVYLPQINGKKGSAKIKRKLNELEMLLDSDDDSEVPSLTFHCGTDADGQFDDIDSDEASK